MSTSRLRLAALAGGLLLVALGVVALVDHELKGSRMHEASVDLWYCLHRGQRCGSEQPHAIEERWERREKAYLLAAGVLVVVTASALALSRLRRRDLRRLP